MQCSDFSLEAPMTRRVVENRLQREGDELAALELFCFPHAAHPAARKLW